MTDHQAPEESSPLEAVGEVNTPAVSDGGEDTVAVSAVGTAATGETEEAVAVAEGIVSAEDLEITAEELDRLYEESLKHIQEGEIVRGRVVQIGRDSVLVDVGYKSEGVIDLDEFPDRGRDLEIGEELDVLLEQKEDSEGQVILSKERPIASQFGTISARNTTTTKWSKARWWRESRAASPSISASRRFCRARKSI